MGEYFELRRLLETRQYRKLDKAKLDRLRDLSRRFQHPKTDAEFRGWVDEVAATEQSGSIEACFEFHLLPHRYDIFSFQREPESVA